MGKSSYRPLILTGAFIFLKADIEGGKILRIDQDGTVNILVENLAGLGDHHKNIPVVKDGYVYFGQRTATYSAVVGKDNADFGWLLRKPNFHDTPCKDYFIKSKDFYSDDNVPISTMKAS